MTYMPNNIFSYQTTLNKSKFLKLCIKIANLASLKAQTQNHLKWSYQGKTLVHNTHKFIQIGG